MEAAEVELKAEVMLETQTESLSIEDQTEKTPSTAVPPTTEPASASAEATAPPPEVSLKNRTKLSLMKKKHKPYSTLISFNCSSPGQRLPVRTFLPVGLSQSQDSPHMWQKLLPQLR